MPGFGSQSVATPISRVQSGVEWVPDGRLGFATRLEDTMDWSGFVPVSAGLGELKRVRAAHLPGSYAEALFARAWSALAGGSHPLAVARDVVDRAATGCRLGAMDRETLAGMGLSEAEVAATLHAAREEVGVALAGSDELRLGEPPAFVAALNRQPRAGATAPGQPRTILEPAESHGDHCLGVAVLGVLIARATGADEVRVFLAGLAHHLHNARMPDSGFAGEVLLGAALEPTVARLTAAEIAMLSQPVADRVRDALRLVGDGETLDGQAFNAADAIDRVQQVHYHARAAAFTARAALVDLDLVHAGPLQAFQKGLLRDAGLMP